MSLLIPTASHPSAMSAGVAATYPPPHNAQQQQQQHLSPLDKLRLALSQRSLHQRCIEVLNVLNAAAKSDLPLLVRVVVDAVFGNTTGVAWELRTLFKTPEVSQDFNTLYQFLSPEGPFLTILYKLTMEPGATFDFPVAFLPSPSRKLIQAGSPPPLFLNKVKLPITTQGSPLSNIAIPAVSPSQLNLNALEYYFYNFALFMVNPCHTRVCQAVLNGYDFIYAHVFEQYLQVFLPSTVEGENLLTPLSSFASPGSWPTPTTTASSTRGATNVTSPFKSGILRANLCGSPVAANSSLSMNFGSIGTDGDLSGLFRRSWRSETFLSVLVEFWLNQNEIDVIEYSDPLSTTGQVFVPCQDLVRFVRLLVKQVHYFANISRNQPPQPPHYQSPGSSNQIDNSMIELRNAAVPVFLRKRIYAFLRHGFEKWPLDQGFRMMLETWLSYIQPWRYVDASQAEREEERTVAVAEEWLTGGFIRDNLLHYVVPFQDFLKRLFRMDLSSPKNAYMLFRVCKVFNQTCLKEYLVTVEKNVTTGVHVNRNALQDSYLDGASFLSPSNAYVNGFAGQIAELERHDFKFKPLFGNEVASSIEQLLQVILQALGTTKSLLPPEPKQTVDDGNVFLTSLASVFSIFQINGDRALTDDMTVADIRRMEIHLRQSIDFLMTIFQVDIPLNGSLSSSLSPGDSSQDQTLTHSGMRNFGPNEPDNVNGVLTDLGRWQLRNGLKRFQTLGYRGDPDLHPIRGYEVAPLVRLLYRLSCAINDRYSARFEAAYSRNDVVGKVARQFLVAPVVEPDKSSPLSAKFRACVNEYSRRPRVSLRFLADKTTLGWSGLALLLCPGFGVGRIQLFLFLAVTWFFFGILMALIKPKTA